MFSKFFKSNDSSGAKKTSRRSSKRTISNGSINDHDELAGKEMMAKAEREIYQFEAPTQELGLTDLIAKHKPGDRFQYLALTGGDTETYEARMRRMITFKPKVNKKMIPIHDLPHIKMIQDREVIGLETIMPKKGEEYVRLHEVSGYFAPTVSVMAKFSKIKIALMDSRFDPPGEIQSVTLNSNMDAKVELSMDYCVPRSAANKIQLMISREQMTMMSGEQWGALQAQIRLEESSFPYMSDMKRVVGILGPTASALEDFEVNPNVLDITMTESNRRLLREFYQQGDIVDEGEPITVKKKAVKYAKSSIKALPKGELAESADIKRDGWEQMVGFRKPQIAAEEASVDPEEEDDGSFEGDNNLMLKSKKAWEMEQARMRQQFDLKSDTTEEIPRNISPEPAKLRSAMRQPRASFGSIGQEISSEEDEEMGKRLKPFPGPKGVAFGAVNV